MPQVADPEIAALIRSEVETRWPADVSGLDELVRYGLVPFGKMMGPWLLVRSALAVGGTVGPVLPAAVAVECVQVGAMMHDDIVDGDGQRRGKVAAHAAFGASSAIVGGDGLYFHGFAALADCQAAGAPVEGVGRALTILSQAGLRIGDAAIQEIRMGGGICSTESYLSMIRDKSGGLLWMACGVGAALSGATELELAALRDYSDLLGIAYQIRDDLMAFDGTRAGKPSTSDARNGRPTLPVLLAHRRAPREHQRAIEVLLGDAELTVDERHRRITALVDEHQGVAAARAMSHRYADEAGRALADLPPSPHRSALAALTVPGHLV